MSCVSDWLSDPQGSLWVLAGRKAQIGDGNEVRRLLPHRSLRTIGAWCFLDHFGPDDISASAGLQVPPHPHIGLQTASWLFDGLVLHRDSLGNEQLIRPGELNLMTSGRGITHSEESPAGTPARPALLHGVQLWIALPKERQFMAPDFAHYAELPAVDVAASRSGGSLAGLPGARVTVVAGEFAGHRSPAVVHTPLVGLEVALPAGGSVTLATQQGFEYGVIAADGPASVSAAGCSVMACDYADSGVAGGARATAGPAVIEPGLLAHLPAGSTSIELSAAGPNRFFVVGGVPLGERLVMWWNFVGRTAEEIASARDSWVAGDGRFGEVRGYPGTPLAAPPLPPGTLQPR
ncbi:MAG: pirin [Actinomycetia bacterium]|nr:pirin [Actinomycetes bacterium]